MELNQLFLFVPGMLAVACFVLPDARKLRTFAGVICLLAAMFVTLLIQNEDAGELLRMIGLADGANPLAVVVYLSALVIALAPRRGPKPTEPPSQHTG